MCIEVMLRVGTPDKKLGPGTQADGDAMNWYEDGEAAGLQIIWRNPAPPRRSGTKPRRLALDTNTTIYVANHPESDALFEVTPGRNLAAVGMRRTQEVCEPWG